MSTVTLHSRNSTADHGQFRRGSAGWGAADTPDSDILPAPSLHQLTNDDWEARGEPPTAQNNESTKAIDPLIRLSAGQLPLRRFKVLQQWEGIVTDVRIDSFYADLLDLTDRTKPREVAEISLDEIAEADHDLLLPGCVFYWIIGYQTSEGGTKERVSEIRVRRNPKWSQRAIDMANARAKKLYDQFKDNGQNEPT